MGSSAEEKQSSRLCHEDGDVEPCSYAMQLVTSSVLPMVMQTSIELGLFDIIAKLGQASASEIASRLPTKNQEAPIILDRMLYLLTTHSVLSCSAIDGDERVYALTPVSKYFASNQGVSFGPLLALIQDKVFMDSWSVCSFSLSLALLSILLTIVPLLTPPQNVIITTHKPNFHGFICKPVWYVVITENKSWSPNQKVLILLSFFI